MKLFSRLGDSARKLEGNEPISRGRSTPFPGLSNGSTEVAKANGLGADSQTLDGSRQSLTARGFLAGVRRLHRDPGLKTPFGAKSGLTTLQGGKESGTVREIGIRD